MKFSESFCILAVKPCVVTSRAYEKVRVTIVSAIAIDVVNMFSGFKRSTERLFSLLHMHWLGASFATGFIYSLLAIDVASYSDSFSFSSLGNVTALLASYVVDNLEYSAVRARIQRLPMLVSRKPWVEGIPSRLTLLELTSLSSFKTVKNFDMSALAFRFDHCAGIISHGAGIA